MPHLKKGDIVVLRDKLLLCKAINMNIRLLSLIIVPESLCRPLFDHDHSGPSGGHMGEDRTLYIMCIRLFRPNLIER